MNCPLCQNKSTNFFKNIYFKCSCCKGIFKKSNLHLKGKDEKNIYDKHVNISTDIKYQNFLSPITNSVLNDFSSNTKGLDFGSGKDSAIVKVLRDNKYKIEAYDLFYKDDKSLLEKKYDYITCSEVIEHFQNPKKEFELLLSMLKENAALYLMTEIYDESISFEKWYYKNDPTHIFFYQKETFAWIQKKYAFKRLEIEKRLIRFYL